MLFSVFISLDLPFEYMLETNGKICDSFNFTFTLIALHGSDFYVLKLALHPLLSDDYNDTKSEREN